MTSNVPDMMLKSSKNSVEDNTKEIIRILFRLNSDMNFK